MGCVGGGWVGGVEFCAGVVGCGVALVGGCVMDPDVALADVREMAGWLLDSESVDAALDLAPAGMSLAGLALALADRVRSLDSWIQGGGFLPADWAPGATGRLD